MDANDTVMTFLRESNAIESVYDDDSLQKAKKAWDYIIAEEQLSIDAILKMHEILMDGKLPPDQLGAFRRHGVIVGGRLGAKWPLIPELMHNWVLYANQPGGDPEEMMHVRYEKIHPFADGNGRTGRILMNWQRLKRGKDIMII